MMANEPVAPTISVVMSCYNAERWIAESVECILKQTWRNYEFIIIDDGSSDRTPHLIKRFAAEILGLYQFLSPIRDLPIL